MNRQSKCKKLIAWFMFIIMNINCFGNDVITVAAAGVNTNQEGQFENDDNEEAEDTLEGSIEEELSNDSRELINDNVYEDITISTTTTLSDDVEVGNLTINSNLHMNGHKITVHGNVTLDSYLYVEEGYLDITGDFYIKNGSNIVMKSANDYILVKNNLLIDKLNSTSKISKGVFEIQGNVSCTNQEYYNGLLSFESESKVVLSGSSEQTIDIPIDTCWDIYNLQIKNTSEEGVVSSHMINATNVEDVNKKLHYETEGSNGGILTEDTVINGDFTLLSGELDLAGYNLTVEGDFIHSGGHVNVNGGSLIIKGNYIKQYIYEKAFEKVVEQSAGLLIMDNDADYVLVEGDYIDSCIKDETLYLTAGTLELRGSYKSQNNLKHYLLHTSGNHVLKISGSKAQELDSSNYLSNNGFEIANIMIDQPEEGSVKWSSQITVSGSVLHKSGNVNGKTIILKDSELGSDLYGTIDICDEYSFADDTVVHGDLYFDGRNMKIENSHVTVTGDCYTRGVIECVNGRLTVNGNFILNDRACTYKGGILELKGNIKRPNNTNYISCESDAKVLFSGTTTQRIEVSSDYTIFENVVVDNAQGVIVSDNIVIKNVSCVNGVVSYETGGMCGFTLEEDMVYDGDVDIAGGVLNLNGHSMHIKGNLTISGGALSMTNSDDYLLVDGSFVTKTRVDHTGMLTDGVLEVKGDFTQVGAYYSYNPTENHTTVFSGTDTQNVCIYSSYYTFFNNVTFADGCNINIENDKVPWVKGVVTQNGKVNGKIGMTKTTSFANGVYKGDVIVVQSFEFDDDLTIYGNFGVASCEDFTIKDSNLSITKKILIDQWQSRIIVKNANIHCGSLTVAGLAYNGLYIYDNDSIVTVDGDFIVDEGHLRLSYGTVEVSGNINCNGAQSCDFTGSVFELNGASKQTIDTATNCKFDKVVINNSGAEGIYVENVLNCNLVENISGCKVEFADGGILGYTLDSDDVIDGDVILAGGNMNLNGHTLTINGDLTINAGSMSLCGGVLYVKGNININSELKLDAGTINVDGDWTSTCDITTDSTEIHFKGDVLSEGDKLSMKNASKLVFDGKKKQTIKAKVAYLNNVTIDNAKGINIIELNYIYFYGEITTNGNPIEGWLNANGVIKDEIINGNVVFQSATINKDLTVEGDVDIGEIKLNGNRLTVCNDAYILYKKTYRAPSTDGIIDIKGDFLTGNSKTNYTFPDGVTIILSGSNKQTIDFKNVNVTMNKLVIANESDEGVYSNSLFNADIIDDPEQKLSFYEEGNAGFVLTKDTVIQGDYKLIAGALNLNGHKLTITGNLNQVNGCVNVNGGELHVLGNYYYGHKTESGVYEEAKGIIKLSSADEIISVDGDFVMTPNQNITTTVKKGVIEIKGDFDYYNNKKDVNPFSSNVIFRFSGKQKQMLSCFGYSDSPVMGTIDIENSSPEGVFVVKDIYINNPVINSEKLHVMSDVTLNWNAKEGFDFKEIEGNLCVRTNTVLHNDLRVHGTLSVYSTFDINGYNVKVSKMSINNKLSINGGLLQVEELNLSDSSSGKLIMNNPDDILQITGNLTVKYGSLQMLDGKTDIKGDVIINNSSCVFGDQHTLTLSGKMNAAGKSYTQTVSIPVSMKFNKLVLTKPREYYDFSRNVEDMCNELVDDVSDITAPSTPTGLVASNIGYTTVTLTWTPSTDDTGISGYDVYRNDKKIMSVNSSSYTDKKLTPGTEYTYYVVAKDTATNTSALSEKYTVETLTDTEKPTVPTDIVLTARYAQALSFSFDAAKDNVAVAGYKIYRDGELVGETKNNEYSDRELLANHDYVYQVLAYDASGNESELSDEVRLYTQDVELSDIYPAEHTKISGKETEISFVFRNSGSKNGYNVNVSYKEKGSTDLHELVNKVYGKNTSYNRAIKVSATLDTTLINAEEITVNVTITDAAGYEVARELTYYLDKTAPSKLKEAGVEVRNGVVVISFEKGREADIAGYRIYRQENGKEKELFLDSPTPDKTYYYDNTVISDKEYTYYVSAYDEEGLEGELSDGLNIVVDEDDECPTINDVTPLNGVINGICHISVKASDNKALDKLKIELLNNQADSKLLAETDISSGYAEYDLDTTKYTNGVSLMFSVTDSSGNENDDDFICEYSIDNEGPAKPTGFSAEVISTTAVLSWDKPTENDYDYAVVEQVFDDGKCKTISKQTTTTGCVIEGLMPGDTTSYKVTFYDIYGNAGVSSNVIDVTAGEDTISPKIVSVSPNGGSYNKKIKLNVNAYDNCNVKNVYVEYSLDGSDWDNLYTYNVETTDKNQVFDYDVDLGTFSDGDIYIRAYAEDTAGNVGDKEQVVIQYIIDHTAPAPVDKLTASGESGSIYLKWNEPVDNDVVGYRVYRSVEGIDAYKCINNNVKTLSFYDRSASYDTSYCYKVTAFDYAGNESEVSNIAIAQKQDDEQKPVVHSLLPVKDSTIAKTVTLSANASDNDKVTSVEFAIQGKEEGSNKTVIGQINSEKTYGVYECKLNTLCYENGEYDIFVKATDANGNISDVYVSSCVIHNVSLDTPELYVTEGNWCVNLHSTLPDSLSYRLFRKCQQKEEEYQCITSGKGSVMFRDVNVNPRYTYIYQLYVEDEAGNSNQSVIQYARPKAKDTEAPKAVINANTSVIEGYETVFSGVDSSDNDRIASYIWDFGDGSEEANGPSPKHTYNTAGEYVAKLTVTDASGNVNYATTKINVLPKQSSGKAVVEVCSISGAPISDVTIYINSSTKGNDLVRTDKKGQAVIMQKPGTYKIALYKPGYIAVEKSVEIELYGEKEYTFSLDEGDTITADFNVRQMDFDEIVAAGIDLTAPENQHVFTVTTKLKFEDAQRTPESDAPIVLSKATSKEKKDEHAGNAEAMNAGGGVYIAPESGENNNEDPEPELYYTLYITQSISWLKDMYEATLIVYNNANSQTIVAKDLTADLILPYGLSLASTDNGQKEDIKIPDIRGGETGSATWYIRGDVAGTYSLNARLNGTLQPFDSNFEYTFTSNEFDVTAGDGLVLAVKPEDRAEKGEPYYVYFTLSNEGSKEFYNIKATFGDQHANSRRFITGANGQNSLPVISDEDVVMIECLKPGEKISGVYRTSIPIDGEKWYNYKRLTEYEYEVLSGNNLGVEVCISPIASHVAVPSLVYQIPTQENSEADPVNVSTGAYTDSISAMSVQGVNPVSADLSYDSNAVAALGEFGYGWTHNYESRLVDMQDGTVRYYVSPTGYYTFLASHFDSEKAYVIGEGGYYKLDMSKLPTEETFKCLNENKAEYKLERDKKGAYTLKDKSGNITCFDKKGNLVSIENSEGKKISVLRQDDSFTVIDMGTERHLTYSLDPDTKLVTSVTDGKREAFFYYDENKCLKQFVNAAGESTYYTYDKKHRITTVTNDDNITYVTNEYVLSEGTTSPSGVKVGRVKSQQDANGNVTKFEYKEDEQNGNLITTVTTRNGSTKKTVTDPYGNVVSQTNEAGNTLTTTYDDNGNETYVNQPDMTTIDGKETSYSIAYKYDSDGNMTSMSNSMLEKGEDEVVMTYDDDGNMLTMKNRNGESMECTYFDNGQIHTVKDQNGNVKSYEYNNQGQILSETDGNNKSIVYNYDKGDLVSVTDRNGNVTEYKYNAEGFVEKTIVKDKVLGQEYTTVSFYDELNRVSSVLDTEGGTTFYEYDCNGNITEKIEPSGSRTKYVYDGNNQLIKEEVYPNETSDNPDSVTCYTYTKEGLLKTVTDAKSNSVITNSYDKVGNKIKETEKNGDKKLSEKEYTYDELGNKTSETVVCINNDGNETGRYTTKYIYYPNSRLSKVIDYTGAETTYSYDKSWRTQTIESTTEPTLTYKYDPAGRVTKEITGNNNGNIFNKSEAISTSYEYDIYGHVTKATDAMNNSTQYRYDANGNLTETEDATGRVAYSKYDSLNRIVEKGIRKPNSNDDIVLARTSYNITAHTVTTTDVVNGGSITSYYDTAGREYKTVNGDGVLLSETVYDTENRILQSVDAKGMVSENVYNSLGQIEKVNRGAKGTKKANGTYSIIGEVRSETYEYDSLGRMNKVTDAKEGVSSVVFDSLGRIVSLKDPNQNAADKEEKAWSVNNGNTYTYEYNEKGLLEQEVNSLGNVTTYEYNADMLLSKITDSANEDTEYEYDSLNRIREVKDSVGKIEYDYDANGNVL
nr:fibronectin type III domain-containing protein [Lachnospiraceae bacterium]